MTTSCLPPTGVLLVNLGTPDAPDAPSVRRYLGEFLNDPRVLDMPRLGRLALLWGVILPTRPQRAAKAYRQIWQATGSPLLTNGEALAREVAANLGSSPVALAMRYGNPSIVQGLEELRAAGCEELVIFPLYPHYASSSTGSTLEAVYKLCAKAWNTPFLRVVPPFFCEPGFIQAYASVARPVLDELAPEHVLFSYHGLPVRQVTKSAPSDPLCGAEDGACCTPLRSSNRLCYRAQCLETTRLLVSELGLQEGSFSNAFQSRLGRTPWIRPFTDEVVTALARAGTRRLAVFSPSFVADCLETIEEIGLRARRAFLDAGGEEFALIPSLNAHPAWVSAAVDLIRRRGK